ncbi:hypothetical protein BX661DRAFT_188896 [Kickxella alabastrina]|uniref:uncharacterized protein n=1 Tax=Kickxella alabastrina TaxID=61397 RepID=UPI00221FAC10|nr:uncharacterized protein BX661DRAFT_188896 [Kickxella alabastrina]KAI7820737.1 hypothetical protein BX661DRAFT_188896 [Kickxella alabastrina]
MYIHPSFVPLVWFAGFWTAVNIVFWIFKRREPPHTSGSDNADQADHTEQSEQSDQGAAEADPDADTLVELVSPLHLRLSSSRFNDKITCLARVPLFQTGRGKQAWDRFYDMGVYTAFLSMFLCWGVLGYGGYQITSALVGKFRQPLGDMAASGGGETVSLLARRYFDASEGRILKPIIPGVTLPVGHFGEYFLALVVCAAVHEWGHALASAFCGAGVRSVGVFVLGVYPGAFVDLAADLLERLSVWEQLRVVCAGVWHNFILAAVVWAVVCSGLLGRMLGATVCKQAQGVAVVDVSASSPLFGRLPLGSTVYRVDDVWLDESRRRSSSSSGVLNNTAVVTGMGGDTALVRWTWALLASSNRDTLAAGFCASAATNVDDGLCCEMSAQYPLGESPDPEIHCFETFEQSFSLGCYDLRAILESPLGGSGDAGRCLGSSECAHGECVVPSSPFAEGRVARIYYDNQRQQQAGGSTGDSTGAVIYVGVGGWIEGFLQYVVSFSLAFCLLNAAPAWWLDGDHALRLALGDSPAVVHRLVTGATTALLACCIVGSIVLLAI